MKLEAKHRLLSTTRPVGNIPTRADWINRSPMKDKLLRDYTFYTYVGPLIRFPREGARSRYDDGTTILMKPMDFGVCPKPNNRFSLVTHMATATIDLAMAKKVARYSKLCRPKNLSLGESVPKVVLDGIWKWFLGEPVQDAEFYSQVANWKRSNIARCFRVMPVGNVKPGEKLKLGSNTFYSASTSASSAMEGWAGWADANNKKAPSGLALVEFTGCKVLANNKKLVSLCEISQKGRTAVSDAAELYKEVWLAGNQSGTVVRSLDGAALIRKYGW